MTWEILPTTDGAFRFTDRATGEIREFPHGFDAMVTAYDELQHICGKVAKALGPAVLKAWEDS